MGTITSCTITLIIVSCSLQSLTTQRPARHRMFLLKIEDQTNQATLQNNYWHCLEKCFVECAVRDCKQLTVKM